jgi:anthranilate phosphoribosyltransferase
MKAVLAKLFEARSLERAEAREAMEQVIGGGVSPEQVGAFLGALRAKRETVDELVGFAEAMRRHARKLSTSRADLVDTCGTGGDGSHTFNISTTSAFVVAASGLGVAKHGNRAVSSSCGSAEVLEALGVPVELSPEAAGSALDGDGFAFLFAPFYHPAMKNVAPVRRALGVRTVFNLLGPLANPALVRRQVLGVFDKRWLEPLARALLALGSEEALVVHGSDGLDEITLTGPTAAAHARGGEVTLLEITPEDAGLTRARAEDLRGGDAAHNAGILLEILSGKRGPRRDAVALNAGAALFVGGLAKSLAEGARIAEEAIDKGRAMEQLERARARR